MRPPPHCQAWRSIKLGLALLVLFGLTDLGYCVLYLPALHAAPKKTTTRSKSTRSVSRQASSPAKKVSPQKASSRKKVTRSRRTHRKPILGQRTIESARVVEIQNALAAAGYYREQPSGQWDNATSKAMSDYQQDKGFKITGKPDALSLKKLGL